MRVIGIDPGSSSWDIFGYNVETNEICIDTSIKTTDLMENPDAFFKALEDIEPFDLMVAPSGFGLPIKKVQELTDEDIYYMTLSTEKSPQIVGLKIILHKLKHMKSEKGEAYVIPGVKHLPTVKKYRKINRIDLGTADKVCSVVVGIRDVMERSKIQSSDANFIMIELGAAFSAIIAVEGGQIIDGIGGSNLMGFKACGPLDAELACLMNPLSKTKIYKGGAISIGGKENNTPEELFLRTKDDSQAKIAIQTYIDNIVKGVFSIKSVFNQATPPNYILISGRLANEKFIEMILDEKLRIIAPVRMMKSYSKIAKRAAQGAAFIAEGLIGGPLQPIIKNLRLEEAKGNILDFIYLPIKSNK
ncbi:MAG: DUF1464 family protein [Promethearchaeota archaeon]